MPFLLPATRSWATAPFGVGFHQPIDRSAVFHCRNFAEMIHLKHHDSFANNGLLSEPFTFFIDSPMPTPKVDVAVAMITCGKRILAIYNPKWGAFSIPMTKRRKWRDRAVRLGAKEEEWPLAASRAAAEVLGRTLAPEELPLPLHEILEYRQNDADGVWKLYNLHVFKLPLPKIPASLGLGIDGEWLVADQLQKNVPVSSTVRYLLKELEGSDKLPPWD